MTYTIKQVATLSYVSTRTLRHYDAIGLLKPASYADNGYRLYGKQQLLLLQQILFYRELGLSLNEIKTVVNADEFNQIKALQSHKHQLRQNISRMKKLMQTIDQTVTHLIDKIPMEEMELYLGFEHPQQKKMKEYLLDNMGSVGEEIIQQAKRQAKSLSKEDVKQLDEETDTLCCAFLELIDKEISPPSPEAQQWTQWYYDRRIKRFAPQLSAEDIIQLVKLEIQHPTLKKRFDAVHPNFAEYFLQAITELVNKL